MEAWVKTPPEPRMMATEATIFTGWIYDHLLPHAETVKIFLLTDTVATDDSAILRLQC